MASAADARGVSKQAAPPFCAAVRVQYPGHAPGVHLGGLILDPMSTDRTLGCFIVLCMYVVIQQGNK